MNFSSKDVLSKVFQIFEISDAKADKFIFQKEEIQEIVINDIFKL
jgi:hypothetical protein